MAPEAGDADQRIRVLPMTCRSRERSRSKPQLDNADHAMKSSVPGPRGVRKKPDRASSWKNVGITI